jgi:ferric-dicitrate binding protein FerR (iron transport regulator)
MKADEDRLAETERRARGVLDESVTRVSGHVRSRLNQARQAALAEIEVRPRSFWRMPAILAPASGVAAAAVVAVVLMHQAGERGLAANVGGQAGYEDIELLSDNDGLELLENWDGSFYEWAATQSEDGDGGASG